MFLLVVLLNLACWLVRSSGYALADQGDFVFLWCDAFFFLPQSSSFALLGFGEIFSVLNNGGRGVLLLL